MTIIDLTLVPFFVVCCVLTALTVAGSLCLTPLAVTWVTFRWLFGRYIGITLKTWKKPPETLQNADWGKHSYAKLKNVKLHYVEKGDKERPLLLLLHGFPDFWYSWRNQLRDLSDRYWVVAVDLRGYGDSDKPSGTENYKVDVLLDDIRRLLHHLGRQQCILVGHDWGGVLAWFMAIRHPEMVQKLIVLNSFHPSALVKIVTQNVKQTIMSWYIIFFQIPYLPELLMWSVVDVLFHSFFWLTPSGRSRISTKDIQAYQYTYCHPDSFTGPMSYYSANFFDILFKTDDLQVKVQTLIIWGMKDPYMCSAGPDISAEHVQDCRLRMIQAGSHWVHHDHPEEVNTHIRDFLCGN